MALVFLDGQVLPRGAASGVGSTGATHKASFCASLHRLSVTHYRPAMPFGNRKFILEDILGSVLSQFKKYQPPGNFEFNNLGNFRSLKFRILMEKKSLQFLLS